MIMFEKREQEIARKTAEAEAKGIVKGSAKEKEANVIGMLGKGYPLEDIAEIAKIGVDDVKAIAHRHGVKLP